MSLKISLIEPTDSQILNNINEIQKNCKQSQKNHEEPWKSPQKKLNISIES